MDIGHQSGGKRGGADQGAANLGHLEAVRDGRAAELLDKDCDIQALADNDGRVEIERQRNRRIAHVVAFQLIEGDAQDRLVPDL